MKQEEKELLLIDLCARALYGVKIHLETPKYGELIGTLDAIYPTEDRVIVDNLDKAIAPINVRYGGFKIEENKVKPYLRPMSIMTEEEKEEYKDLLYCIKYADNTLLAVNLFISWLNTHHFDYHGLIEKGIALPAPEGMYQNK